MTASIVLKDNCTQAALDVDGVFTGKWQNVSDHNTIICSVATDQTGVLYLQFSVDGNDDHIDSSIPYDYIAGNIYPPRRLTAGRGFYRIRYVNGSVAQTYLRIQSMAGSHPFITSVLHSEVAFNADSLLTRPFPVDVDLATDMFRGIQIFEKFGYNLDVDPGDVPEDVWGPGGVYTGFPRSGFGTIDIYSTSANDALGGTGLEVVTLFGLDNEFNLVQEEINLNGTTHVTTSNVYSRVFRIRGEQSNNGNNDTFNDGIIVTELTASPSVVFTRIPVGLNQTVLGGYTVPANKTLLIQNLTVTMAANSNSTAEGAIWVRPFDKAPRLIQYFTCSVAAPFDLSGRFVFQEKTDFIVRITSVTNNNTGFSTQFRGLLIDNIAV